MMDQTVRIGILGAAGIAEKNVRAIAKCGDAVEVVAVGSRALATAQAFVERNGLSGVAKPYGSYQEVLDDQRVDAVYVPLPTALHVEWVHKATAAGKHILLEKPIAQTAAQTDEIVAACQTAGVQLMDSTMFMHNLRLPKMEAVLRDEAAVVHLRCVNSTFAKWGDPDFHANDIRTKPGLDGLGALGDLGWHTQGRDGMVLMHVGATIVWPSGCTAMFECAFDIALTQELQVIGTQGSISLHDFVIPFHEEECSFVATSKHAFGHLEATDVTQRDQHTVYLHGKPQETRMWETFAECVRQIKAGGKPQQHWVDIAVMTQKVVCAIADSADQNGRLTEV